MALTEITERRSELEIAEDNVRQIFMSTKNVLEAHKNRILKIANSVGVNDLKTQLGDDSDLYTSAYQKMNELIELLEE